MTVHNARSSRGPRASLLFASVLVLSACTDPTKPASKPPAAQPHFSGGGQEGEFLGNVYTSGSKTKNAGYYVVLHASNAATAARLHFQKDTQWVDTSGGAWQFEWSDPRGGGNCGDIAHYLALDTMDRSVELHRPGPGQSPSGREKHCIRPGQYVVTLVGGGRSFTVDYPAILHNSLSFVSRNVFNTTSDTLEAMEQSNYDDTLASYSDLIVNFDLTGGSFSETRVLDLENGHASATKDTFTNQPSPTGSETDSFRFSMSRSTTTWNLNTAGRILSRLFWDYTRNMNQRTGYWYSEKGVYEVPVDRVHAYTHLTQSESDTTALETMRPDESPDSTRVTKRVVQITRSAPYACSTFEAETTWIGSDQYMNSACSDRNSGVQFRWQTDGGGSWTAYSSDTIYDFLGYGSTGTHTVTLDADSSGHSGFSTTNILTTTGQVTFSAGATYITSKATQIYRSNHYGVWYERYDPALRWYPASVNNQDTLAVIWPAGAYTDQLRNDSSTGNTLRRGRLTITVCDPPSSCGANAPSVGSAPASSTSTSLAWNVFGAGPWISWGSAAHPQAVRLYDLWGQHDMPSPFGSATWVTDTGSIVQDAQDQWSIRWHLGPQLSANARVFEFSTTSTLVDPVSFGMALDPDIGSNAADDISGFDSERGMVYATDGSGAVGFLLRDSTQSAVYAVQQFGRSNPSPSTRAGAYAAQHQGGVHLVAGPRDVQLVMTAAPRAGLARYWFAVIRGTSLSDLQIAADSVVNGLNGVAW